jgi:TPR repeat protein
MRMVILVIMLFAVTGLLYCEVTFSNALLKEAKAGNAEAQYNLGLCYEKGLGVKTDMDEAVKWYQMAANQGLAPAQYVLGRYFISGKKAVKQSSPKTQKDPGNLYKDPEVNYPEAVKWFRLAAGQGDAAAQFSLGECLYTGKGTDKNIKEAVKWFRLAAAQENSDAQNSMAICYHQGDGVIKDYAEAEKWYILASQNGCAEASANLAKMYFSDYDIRDRVEESYFWWLVAAADGVQGAQVNRDNVGQLLYNPQKDKLTARATKWFEKYRK